MRILISNDDGYHAPGIRALAKALAEIADVTIVAPDRNRSGASNSLTLEAPLRITQIEENIYYVNGTPTDCVHLAINVILKEKPDFVVSGINDSYNLADDVLYSGTVAAAIEGRSMGIPAIAFSIAPTHVNFEAAARVAKELVLKMEKKRLPPKTILNVNLPDLPFDKMGAYEITRLGSRHAAESALKQTDPHGREVFWINGPGAEADSGPGTDINAVNLGNISITPMRVEWTNFEAFNLFADWVK
jgi:5'-nucleotidase